MTAGRVERIGSATLYLGRCEDVLPTLGMFAACITDPPYHGVKADAWDNQWLTDADFLAWVSSISDLVAARLASSGSLYWFASPQMAARVEVELRRLFTVRNLITWDKADGRKGIGGTGIDVTALRCFWSASSERIIFAEQRGCDEIAADVAGYDASCVRAKAEIFGTYIRSEMQKAGVTGKELARLFPSRTGGMTGCVSNWLLGLNVPTPGQYGAIRQRLNGGGGDYLRREYEDLRREYEDLRRPFNATPADQWGDVWRFPVVRNAEHPTQKPIEMLRHMVAVSTRPGDMVLDPFAGSGTCGVACVALGRSFVGIERDPKYFAIACERIEAAQRQSDLFITPPGTAAYDRPLRDLFAEPVAS